MSNSWIPEIMYEETDEGLSSHIPFIEMDLHQYADMIQLKSGLDELTYNKVRNCLGLEPLREAAEKGSKITESIRKKIDKS